METFAPGDRVVAINLMPVPLYWDGNCGQHPFLLPDGPLRKDVIYHVAGTVMRPNGMQGVYLTGLRLTWGSHEIPWASSRFRKVDTLRDCAPKKRRRKQPITAAPLVTASLPELHPQPHQAMAFFKQIEKPSRDMDDCEHLSALGDDPDAWDDLDDEELKQVIGVKFIEYGATQDGSRIPGLFALYRHAMERLDVSERREMLTEFSGMIEQHQGFGHMGLLMFIAADTDPGIRSSAALSLSVLYDPSQEGQDELAGPRFVIRTLVRHDGGNPGQGAALGGVLLLGDKRIMPLLAEVWDDLSEKAQLEMTTAKSGFVSEGVVEFWLDRLEEGCSESVFGSAVAAIAKMPVVSQIPFVMDIERLLPAYAGGEPMRLLRRTSFADYLEEIRPRLEALEAEESEPKVVPRIFEMWENRSFPPNSQSIRTNQLSR